VALEALTGTAANERLAQRLWVHRDHLFTFLRQPGLDATNERAELAIRFGVILRKVWDGSREGPPVPTAGRREVGGDRRRRVTVPAWAAANPLGPPSVRSPR
jgi:hypothetical protein